MIDYSDDRWNSLIGGYKVAYNPAPILKKLEDGDDIAAYWHELWENLYHQGDVGDASYAAVVKLIETQTQGNTSFDWNFYALTGMIELARHKNSPTLPAWLKDDYNAAMQKLYTLVAKSFLGTENPLIVKPMLGILALSKKQIALAEVILDSTDDEIAEYLAN